MAFQTKKRSLAIFISCVVITSFAYLCVPSASYSDENQEPKSETGTETTTQESTKKTREVPEITSISDAFEGEELIYDMGFWIFKKIARGEFRLTKEPDGTFKAVLDASSKALLFRSTRSTYTAYMKVSTDGQRFITLRFEKYSKKKGTVKKIVKELDHERGILTITKWKNDKLKSTEEIEIPENEIYDDPLAAFYNLRFGAYGPIKEGGKYLITTFPEKGKEVRIRARITGKKELKKGVRKRKNNAKMLMRAKLDKELFDSSSGDIDIYFDDKMVAIDVVAKDILLFGDIYARLKSNTRLSAKETPVTAPEPTPEPAPVTTNDDAPDAEAKEGQ